MLCWFSTGFTKLQICFIYYLSVCFSFRTLFLSAYLSMFSFFYFLLIAFAFVCFFDLSLQVILIYFSFIYIYFVIIAVVIIAIVYAKPKNRLCCCLHADIFGSHWCGNRDKNFVEMLIDDKLLVRVLFACCCCCFCFRLV